MYYWTFWRLAPTPEALARSGSRDESKLQRLKLKKDLIVKPTGAKIKLDVLVLAPFPSCPPFYTAILGHANRTGLRQHAHATFSYPGFPNRAAILPVS